MNCELFIQTKCEENVMYSLGLLFYGFEFMRGALPPPLTKTKPPNFIVKNASLFIFVVSGGNSFHSWKFHSLTIYWELILNEWKLVPHPTSLDDFVVIPLLEKKTNIECFVDLK